MTAGTNSFVYIGAVGNESQIAVANSFIWIFLLLVQTMLVVDNLTISFNYGIFFVITALGGHFINKKVKSIQDKS